VGLLVTKEERFFSLPFSRLGTSYLHFLTDLERSFVRETRSVLDFRDFPPSRSQYVGSFNHLFFPALNQRLILNSFQFYPSFGLLFPCRTFFRLHPITVHFQTIYPFFPALEESLSLIFSITSLSLSRRERPSFWARRPSRTTPGVDFSPSILSRNGDSGPMGVSPF